MTGTPNQSKRKNTTQSEDFSFKRPKTVDIELAPAKSDAPVTSEPSDGDVEVIAGTTLFCVHMNKMKSLGGIFATIFDVPQPPDTEELPRLPLFETNSNDARYLMAYAYGDVVLNQMTDDNVYGKVPWYATTALLKLSHKYDLVSLRYEVMETLKFLLPCGPTYTFPSSTITGVPISQQALFQLILPLEAVRLCREYELGALLPMAFYYAAQLPIADIAGGIYRGESDTIEWLSTQDIITVLAGRDKLKLANRNIRFSYLNEFNPLTRSEGCQGDHNKWGHCANYLTRTSRQFNRDGFLDSRTDVLDPMPQVRRKISAHLCSNCANDFKLSLEAGVASIWENLPSYFNLGGWGMIMQAQHRVDERYRD